MKKEAFGVDIRILFLGIVSFLTDVSSEMIFSIFSIFFTVILGASVVLLGFVEGLADFSSSSLDYISGFLSDRTGKRKYLSAIGYGFSTLSKLILAIKNNIIIAAGFRILERLGKSFRGPPRDSWIASISKKRNRGYSFGLHNALDKSGAVVGPLIAFLLISYLGQTRSAFNTLFIVAFIPALLAVILLLLIKEKPAKPKKHESIFNGFRGFGKGLKHYIYTAGIFSLAYFSFSFLLLKAYIVGFQIKDVILLYALFNISFVLVSIPIGKIGDKIGRKAVIASEYVIYLLMSLGFVFISSKSGIILLFVVFGIFYAIDEGQSKAYISDLEKEKRATAIGSYNFITGLVYLPASVIAGFLWKINPNYAFIFASAISIIALVFFLFMKSKNK